MTEQMLELVLTHDAQMSLSSLGGDDRRRVSNLLEHLRRGRDDEFVRDHSLAVATLPNHFVLQTRDWLVFFQLTESDVTVLSIMRPDVLRAVQPNGQKRP